MTPEQKLHDKLARGLAKLLPKGRYHLQKIETSTTTGVHDCYFRFGSFACWLETKTLDYGVTKEQYAFSHREKLAGGDCWVVTEVNGVITFLSFDSKMVGYRTLRQYLRDNMALELSLEGWAKNILA